MNHLSRPGLCLLTPASFTVGWLFGWLSGYLGWFYDRLSQTTKQTFSSCSFARENGGDWGGGDRSLPRVSMCASPEVRKKNERIETGRKERRNEDEGMTE